MYLINFIRAGLYYLIFLLTVLYALIVGYIILIFLPEKLRRQKRLILISQTNGFLTKYIAPWVLGINYQIIGEKYLIQKPVIFMMRHESAWETIASIGLLPLHTWVLKRELLWIPLFGWALNLSSPIAINRSDKIKALKEVVGKGRARIGEGISLLIFPEGTRMPPRQIGEFKAGGSFLAKQLNLPIIPIAHNAGLYWAKNSFVKKSGKILLIIGKPINLNGENKLSVSDINKRIEKWMRRVIKIIEP